MNALLYFSSNHAKFRWEQEPKWRLNNLILVKIQVAKGEKASRIGDRSGRNFEPC